jgi:para-nitrobenzyl esterase
MARTPRFSSCFGILLLLGACDPDSEVDATEIPATAEPGPPTPPEEPAEPEWEATYQSGTQVEVETGLLSGSAEGDLRVFKGIPYAAPPVAGLRLRDPEPPLPWTGIRDASAFGPVCPQKTVDLIDSLSQVDHSSEDCLTLNIWAHDDGTAKPVMVWIHGGAFFYGAGSQDLYDGAALAREDVVVVTLNYRLGALGYLAHPGIGGNFGLKDQVRALEWVRDNIAAFGGDPDNVTVFGESAGGISTCALVATPAAEGLIDKAILQSAVGCHLFPTATAPGALGTTAPEDYGAEIVQELGCSGASDTLECLQAVPVDAFVDVVAATGLLTDMNAPFPMPYVDGDFLPEQPALAIASGDVDLPMILGTTEDEATMFLTTQAPLTWFGMDDELEAVLPDPTQTDAVLDLYPLWQFPLVQDAFLTFATDWMFSCPNREVAASTSDGAPVWLYEFQDIALPTALLGSHHALELPYLFDTFGALAILPSPSDRALGDAMRGAWASFARDGVPQIEGGWAPFEPGGEILRLDDDWSPMSDHDFRDGRCDALVDLGVIPLP